MEIDFDFGRDIKTMIQKLKRVDDDLKDKCVGIMRQLVQQFKAEAIKRVPIDEGMLEKSFSTKVIDAALMDEVTGVVYVASNALASDYAIAMHEWDYELGEQSQRKEAASGVIVGQKYLERALSENEKAFGRFIYRKWCSGVTS